MQRRIKQRSLSEIWYWLDDMMKVLAQENWVCPIWHLLCLCYLLMEFRSLMSAHPPFPGESHFQWQEKAVVDGQVLWLVLSMLLQNHQKSLVPYVIDSVPWVQMLSNWLFVFCSAIPGILLRFFVIIGVLSRFLVIMGVLLRYFIIIVVSSKFFVILIQMSSLFRGTKSQNCGLLL
jgi:hypothetical protein